MPYVFKTSTSGGGTTTLQYGNVTLLPIASASLSGGMQQVAATGTLPERLTMRDDRYMTGSGGAALLDIGNGVIVDADSVHFWTVYRANATVRKHRLEDGVLVRPLTTNDISGSTTDDYPRRVMNQPEGLTSNFAKTRFWTPSSVSQSNGGHVVHMIDHTVSPPRVESFSLPDVAGGPPLTVNNTVVRELEEGKVWVRTSRSNVANWYEYWYHGTGSANSMVYTGRMYNTDGIGSAYDLIPDGQGNVFTLSSAFIKKYPVASIGSGTVPIVQNSSSNFNIPQFGGGYRSGQYEPNSGIIFCSIISGEGLWFAATGSDLALLGRAFPGGEFGHPDPMVSTSYQRDCISFSPDVNWMVCQTPSRSSYSSRYPRVVYYGPQRARWTFSPGVAGTVNRIGFSGELNRAKGATNVSHAGLSTRALNQEYNHEVTKLYYSTDGGANRTEFKPGENISLALTALQTLTIDVEMQWHWSSKMSARPWTDGGWVVFSPS